MNKTLVEDILGLINDNMTVVIIDRFNSEVALYDGKDSIPEEYNLKEVSSIFLDANYRLCIQL